MSLSGTPAPSDPAWRRILGERPDETFLRAMFRLLVAGSVFVLGYDVIERVQNAPDQAATTLLPGEAPDVQPFLPSARPDFAEPGEKRPGRAPRAELQKPMTIELVSGGRLELTGVITPGSANRLKDEIDKRGDYVKSVVLNSPGGSVQDALAMSKLIRAKGLSTRVETTGHCASSCPLVFAGGVERLADKGASIGVHQVFALSAAGALADTGMADAQRVSAECQRLLVDMGVDPRVWIHAMETPPQELFYFTPEELMSLKLATAMSKPAAARGAAAK
ncbi:hypothetical protein [Flaviflagellibacter deserti]|uniref:Periplasmic protein n=1 Tax=Flaviflagellibacter deserti TaxID=2267266 RepID=A0ABV9YZY6_9HYPH